jgi:hypothetical protein
MDAIICHVFEAVTLIKDSRDAPGEGRHTGRDVKVLLKHERVTGQAERWSMLWIVKKDTKRG